VETTPAEFKKTVSVDITTETKDEATGEVTTTTTTKSYNYAELAMNTSIAMKGLKVKSAYTTDNGGNNDGAMTLTCTVNGRTVTIRTTLLYNEDFSLVTASAYLGKTIDVVGVIDSYNGQYQIKVFQKGDITVH
jgi:hypothetical protein